VKRAGVSGVGCVQLIRCNVAGAFQANHDHALSNG